MGMMLGYYTIILKPEGYAFFQLVRETAIQCLVAVSELPHARIYPMRMQVAEDYSLQSMISVCAFYSALLCLCCFQVLHAISKALDDPKRAVRQEAVRCRQAWSVLRDASIIP